MEHEALVLPVQPHHIDLVPGALTELPPGPGAEQPAPTAEQVRVADRAFAPDHQTNLAAGLLGMQFGVLMLRDLAAETFDETGEGEEAPRRPVPEES